MTRSLFRATWVWATMYLAAIPIFALLYAADGSFAISGTDAATREHRDWFIESLGEDLERTFEASTSQPVATLVSIVFVSVEDNDVHFRTRLSVSASGHRVEGPTDCYIDGSGTDMNLDLQLDQLYVFCQEKDSPVPGLDVNPATYLGTPDSSVGAGVGEVRVSGRTMRRYEEIQGESAGRVGVGLQRFWRMLYFSGITITTVGFGDIVPLSDGMRVLVGIEAVGGVVLVGLFLNSIALRLAGSASERDSSIDRGSGATGEIKTAAAAEPTADPPTGPRATP